MMNGRIDLIVMGIARESRRLGWRSMGWRTVIRVG
jgi:hypothetical protein